MAGAGMKVEDSKGECNLGQHEINFHYGAALRRPTQHVVFKTGAKEIAAQKDRSMTFMAKYDEARGQLVPHPPVAGHEADGTTVRHRRPLFDAFLAG